MWPIKRHKAFDKAQAASSSAREEETKHYIREMEKYIKAQERVLDNAAWSYSSGASSASAGGVNATHGYGNSSHGGYGSDPRHYWYTATMPKTLTDPLDIVSEDPEQRTQEDPVALLHTRVEELSDKLEAAWELINELATIIDERETR